MDNIPQYSIEFSSVQADRTELPEQPNHQPTNQLLREQARQGNAEAALQIANRLIDSKDEGTLQEGLGWLETASRLGSLDAKRLLALRLVVGSIVPKDTGRALRLLEEAANGGNTQAGADLGAFYFQSDFVSRDIQRAKKWLTIAANNNDAQSLELLAEIYLYGLDGEKSPIKAAQLYKTRALSDYRYLAKALSALHMETVQDTRLDIAELYLTIKSFSPSYIEPQAEQALVSLTPAEVEILRERAADWKADYKGG
jgi:TPR repeat protein